MATGRPYDIGVPSGVRVIKADDHVTTKVDIPPIPGMGRLIRGELSQRGFKEQDDGTLVRERNGVRTTLNPDDGSLKVETGGEIKLPPGPPGSGCGCRIAAELARANQATDDLQKQITGRLAEALPGIGCEIEGAIHRGAKKAIKEVAEGIGNIKQISEEKDGSMTIVVEVPS